MNPIHRGNTERAKFGKLHHVSILLRIFILGVVFAGSCWASTPGITVVSNYFSISGSWNETWFLTWPVTTNTTGTFSWSSTESQPLSGSVISTPCGFNDATSTVGPFSLEMRARSVALGSGMAGAATSPTYMSISAVSRTLFQSDAGRLLLSLSGFQRWYYHDKTPVGITLTDVTDQSTLLNMTTAGWGWDFGPLQREIIPFFSIDPTHVYALELSGMIYAHDADDTRFSVFADIIPVPEPGLLSLFLLGAFVMMYGCKGALVR